MNLVINLFFYSRSFLLGFRDASLDKKPNVNRDTKNITVVYTTIFNVNISYPQMILILTM